MEGITLVDYTQSTLIGIFIVLIAFGRLVPWSIVRDKNERIAHLESALDKSLDAISIEQAAHSETRRMLNEERRTGEIVRRVFEDGTG